MIIIADKRIPEPAKTKLKEFGNVHYLSSEGITYPAISGHPDIFFCKLKEQLIIAPNTTVDILNLLTKESINITFGRSIVGSRYPVTASYNAVVTDKYFIHNTSISDSIILEKTKELEVINVKQAYTRCSLLPLKNDRFITSDKGIEKELQKRKLDVLYVNPDGILLPGQINGFIGGSCGNVENKIFFLGNLDYYSEGDKIRNFTNDYEVIELYEGSLFDGGSLIFIP